MQDIELSIILPTYNEAENIPILVERLEKVLKDERYEIIVVDDNSPDMTWQIAADLGTKKKELCSIRRLKARGLSSAVLEGFSVASGKFLLVMDADLQHDETIIPEIINRFRKGSDIVVGSRKVEGGGIDKWSLHRRIISWGATVLAKIFIGNSISDPMSGFFGITCEVFNEYGPRVNPRGFKILLEFVARAKGKKIDEVGFIFKSRIHGESKLTSSVIIEYLRALYDLSIGRYIPVSFIQYGIVGSIGVLVNMGVLYIALNFLGLHQDISLGLAIELSIISNFLLNNYWTFKTAKLTFFKPIIIGLFSFHLICLVGALINFSVAKYSNLLFNINIYISNLLGIAIATLWNYIVNTNITWRQK